ncbi:MAG: VCBS repeat-containing protein [Spirochaetia bacterium]|nr:VCBS repeat-containing protein [Spirochaetia bacterium]
MTLIILLFLQKMIIVQMIVLFLLELCPIVLHITGTILVDDNSIIIPEYPIITPLLNSNTYFWRVKIKNDDNIWGDWSSIWSFSIEIYFTEHIITNTFDNASDVYTFDVDKDGDMDILGTARDAGDIVWWENSLQLYTAMMEEIKKRLAVVVSFMKGSQTTGFLITDVEFVCLHFRKVLEHIALSSLIANKEEYTKQYKNFKRHWNARRILEGIEKINSEYYPQPTV